MGQDNRVEERLERACIGLLAASDAGAWAAHTMADGASGRRLTRIAPWAAAGAFFEVEHLSHTDRRR
jgi:hypothetical protein